ncbi:transcription factor PIF7 [Argentina anserina]|uniref:transcription factor PIF7 n=1 Tax=Argentina anserina TaxID=57926 RepID=UPI0021764239|nr:transcription factor PIF7 [Potentilla anserina]
MQQQQQHPSNPSITHLVPLSNYDVTHELKLENGHLAIHGLGGLVPTAPARTTWSNRACDTLESIVHQATCHQVPEANLSSMVAPSCGTRTDDYGQPMANGWIRKHTRSDSDYHGKNVSSTSTTSNVHEEPTEYHMHNETTLNTWTSFGSTKTKSNDDDFTCHEENQDVGGETTKDHESGRSRSRSRPRRIAAIHNQSERKRRDRINQKMKDLQRLVPNANKTDKASMLDEVIRYLELLQAQVQMMHSMRNNMQPHMNMMMPSGMQQQQQQQHLHQMSVLARMGMTPAVPGAIGMGMVNVGNMARMSPHQSVQQPLIHPTPASFLPPFMVPQMMPPNPEPATNCGSDSFADPYCAFLAQQQSMNMDLFNKMAAVFRQQVNHQSAGSSQSQSKH